MKRHALLGAAVVAAAFALTTGTALADAIDGNWCNGEQRMSIRGPEIVTPTGLTLTGDYTRHAFAYDIPDGEPVAGERILMFQLNEQTIRVHVDSTDNEGEIWERCQFTS